jgi:hypothetical protein
MRHQGHWRDDPGLRLFLVALVIVLAVFFVAFLVMADSAGGGLAAVTEVIAIV